MYILFLIKFETSFDKKYDLQELSVKLVVI